MPAPPASELPKPAQLPKSTQLVMAALTELLAAHYRESDFPALAAQRREWVARRPLSGLRVLDATPVFTNTTAKYLPLLAGGAELTVSVPSQLPHDASVVALLRDLGLAVVAGAPELLPRAREFDLVLDCAGLHADVPSRLGYAELTASGAAVYQGCPQPVILVDGGRLKRIETALGTGDGFVRAMAQLGHGDPAGRSVVVFGGGKVGSGVARHVCGLGASVIIVDAAGTPVPQGSRLVALDRPDEVRAAIAAAWCVVSATGVAGALAPYAQALGQSRALIANMGVEDEFGPDLPEDRVLNAKAPLNFVLAEPTRMRYLEPVLALHNGAALALCAGNLTPGVQLPDPGLEDAILAVVRERGAISAELAGWL